MRSASPEKDPTGSRLPRLVAALAPAVLVAAIATVCLYRSPFDASNFETFPDAVEYALAARHLVSDGHYEIVVDGRALPPRYPPWFSLVVLAPSYLVLGNEPGNGIVPVTALGVAGIVAAFLVGSRIGSSWSGAAAALAVVALPDYRFWGRQVMTDVPVTALILFALLLYLRARSGSESRPAAYLRAGLLVAGAALLRPAAIFAVLPFARAALTPRRPHAARRLTALVSPSVVAAAATLAYDATTFGSPLRDGYRFWCAVPYDYLSLVFSLRYVAPNLEELWASGLSVIAAGGAALLALARIRRAADGASHGPAEVRGAIEFFLLGVLPVVALHLLYFFPSSRFDLVAAAVAVAIAGALLGSWCARLPRAALAALLALVLAAVAAWRTLAPDAPPKRRLAVERIRSSTPLDSLVITGIEPAYVEMIGGGADGRRFLPISRHVEYADKLIARAKVRDPDPPPRDWSDHRCEGLRKGGAEEAVRAVAAEEIDDLERAVRDGKRVFLDASFVAQEDEPILLELVRRFRFLPRGEKLYELLRPG